MYELLILLQVNLVWRHISIRWIVVWKDWIALLWSRSGSQKRFIIPVNAHLNGISTVAEPSNLVWWCSITGQNIMQEDWFPVFRFRITVRAYFIKYDCFYHMCWTADLFATKFGWYIIIGWSVLCKKIDCCFCGQDHSAGSKFYWIFVYLLSLSKVGVLIYY